MNEGKFTIDAEKIRKDQKMMKIVKLVIVLIVLFLIFSYLVIGFVYNSGNFTITLDDNLYYDKGLIITDDIHYKTYRSKLDAQTVDAFDNISEGWLAADLADHPGGSHNGENYMAYTFYIENVGEKVTDYYTEIVIDDVIKNVDEAVRIRVYKDGEYVTYAKASASGEPEEGTVAFESDKLVASDHVEDFGPDDTLKYTVVIWLEGTDPECTNNIIGGEIKMQMKFNSELVEK